MSRRDQGAIELSQGGSRDEPRGLQGGGLQLERRDFLKVLGGGLLICFTHTSARLARWWTSARTARFSEGSGRRFAHLLHTYFCADSGVGQDLWQTRTSERCGRVAAHCGQWPGEGVHWES